MAEPKEITSYRHPPAESTQEPDTKPGDYYVSIRDDAGRTSLALGPFRDDHAGALARVREVWDYVSEHYSRSVWWAFGTCRLDHGDNPVGKLNETLGLAS